MSAGRGFLAFRDSAERAAFSAYMKDMYEAHGGRNAVGGLSGISWDTLGKYSGGRAVPSRATLQTLIDAGMLLEYGSPESFAAAAPWKAGSYRRAGREALDKQALKMDNYKPAVAVNEEVSPEPVQVAPVNLIDAVMAEPGLSAKQRAQLAAIIALVANNVEINIDISPRR